MDGGGGVYDQIILFGIKRREGGVKKKPEQNIET